MPARNDFVEPKRWLRRVVALLCLVTALPVAECAAADPPPLSGRLYLSVFKRLPQGLGRKARQILVVDMETGRYEEVGAPGLGPRVSPDGTQIAYWTFGGQNESFQAWIKHVGRSDEPRFLSYGQVSGWLNDGRELIPSAGHRPEGAQRSLYVNCRIDASGANRRDIDLPPEVQVDDCTADGKWLLVSGVERRQLHIIPGDGGAPKRVSLAAHRTFRGRFSPDGEQVAYIVSATPDRVVIVDRDGSNWREVCRGAGLTDPEEVCWSPDGKRLAVVLFDSKEENGRRIRQIDHDHSYRVVIVDTDTKAQQPLVLEGLSVLGISGLDWR